MKKSIGIGAILFVLSFSAQATLISDFVSGSSIGMTAFNAGSVEVTNGGPEFAGTVDGPGTDGLFFNIAFDFGPDSLNISIDTNRSGTTYPLDFSVTFTDIDWVGQPNYILSGVTLDYDTPEDDFPGYYTRGEGLEAIVGDHSLQLNFTSFPVPEFRSIDLGLISEEDTGGTNNPVPEPATLALLGMGVAGLVARKKMA